MANAPNRMTRRLAITIASYLDRHRDWPTEARLSPEALYWVVQTLDARQFARLADRLKVRVTRHSDIAVGGPAGHLVYPPTPAPSFQIVERVERELGFDEVVFDPPSQTLVDLTAVLFGQEVFHQLVLQELLALTDLGQRLGIWSHTQPPAVVSEPRRGLFDLGLAQFAVGVERPIEVYLELKVGSHLEADQFEQQLEGAADVQRVYLLLGSTYFRWRHAGTATFIGVTELAAAITAIGAKYTGTPGEIARVYGARLSEEAERWSQTMDPTHTWDALDYFRFYAEVAPTWPVEVNIYPVTNRSGQQYVLNAPSSWSTPTGPEWQDGQVYWELVNGRLRYKLQWDGASGARLGRRRAWQEALRGAALERGEELHQPRSSHGRAMTVAELGGDIREVLIHEGSVDVQRSRDLYDRASRLFDLAVRRLELATP